MFTIADLHALYEARHDELRLAAHKWFSRLDPESREEAAQAVLALTWHRLVDWFNNNDHEFTAENVSVRMNTILVYSCKQVSIGRRMPLVEGERNSYTDIHSRHEAGTVGLAGIYLFFDRSASVYDQVQTKVDLAAFLATQSPERQRLIGLMIDGYSTKEMADMTGVTPGRISQLRSYLRAKLEMYFSE